MTPIPRPTAQQLKKLAKVVSEGVEQARAVLTRMTGSPFEMRSTMVNLLPLDRAHQMAGGPSAAVVAVYSAVHGDLEGHIMLCLPEAAALNLVDLLLEQPAGTSRSLGGIEQSALGEIGNVTCSSVLNTLADCTGLKLCPTPPVIVVDMLGAVMSTVLAEIGLAGDDALVATTSFGEAGHDIGGYLFLLPGVEAVPALFQALGAGP